MKTEASFLQHMPDLTQRNDKSKDMNTGTVLRVTIFFYYSMKEDIPSDIISL